MDLMKDLNSVMDKLVGKPFRILLGIIDGMLGFYPRIIFSLIVAFCLELQLNALDILILIFLNILYTSILKIANLSILIKAQNNLEKVFKDGGFDDLFTSE